MPPKASKRPAEESRNFIDSWTSDYFFVEVNSKATCLICNFSLGPTAMKKFNVARHYDSIHKDKEGYGKLTDDERKSKVESLSRQLMQRQNMFKKPKIEKESVLKASYIVCEEIAKSLKPHAEGEFVKKCMLKVVEILAPDQKKKFEDVSLSRPTVCSRIADMSNNLATVLKETVSEFEHYSVALDESTDRTNTAQLAIFVRGVSKDFKVTEELLDLKSLHSTTRGVDVFEKLDESMTDNSLPWAKLSGVASDGAAAMVGENQGVVGLVKKKVASENLDPNNLFICHCFIHQENLCAKCSTLINVMNVLVKCVNVIKSQGLNHVNLKHFLKIWRLNWVTWPIIPKCAG